MRNLSEPLMNNDPEIKEKEIKLTSKYILIKHLKVSILDK